VPLNTHPLTRVGARVLVIVGLGLLAVALWLTEVLWIKGWQGLRWLEGYPWAAVPVCLLVALGALIAIRGETVRPVRRPASFVVAVGITSWTSFEIARVSLIALHTPNWLFLDPGLHALALRISVLSPLMRLALALALASVGVYVSVRFFLRPMSRWTILYLAAALLLVIPASLLTIRVVPAINGTTDYLHAVKMGYPTFWTVVLVGAAVALGCRATRASAG